MTLHKALFITAANRPNYFHETMSTWRKARGFYDWKVVIRLEPTPQIGEHLETIEELEHPNLRTIINPEVYGVLHHPWVGFNELFEYSDFVLRGEDDLLVSDDVLEYFEWAAETYKDDKEIAAAVGYTGAPLDREKDGDVHRDPGFGPWVWGTWYDRWDEYIRDTWDHDYSTYNERPGIQAGWDWNLNTRVLPGLSKKCIYPAQSRVQNIGVVGVHGTAQNFVQSESFVPHRDPVSYVER